MSGSTKEITNTRVKESKWRNSGTGKEKKPRQCRRLTIMTTKNKGESYEKNNKDEQEETFRTGTRNNKTTKEKTETAVRKVVVRKSEQQKWQRTKEKKSGRKTDKKNNNLKETKRRLKQNQEKGVVYVHVRY